MMRICSLASSSSGNCIYVGTDTTHILVDSGISGKKFRSGLDVIDLDPGMVDAILITHEHNDHVKGLGVVSRKYAIPVYATRLTWKKIISSGITGPIDENLFHEIAPDESFAINEVLVHPFNTSHDAVQPVCFTFSNGGKKISVITDLGCYDSYTKEKISGSNILFIEANHDIDMLKNGSYPHYLKKRILSNSGHLSNEMSGSLVSDVHHDDLQYVILGHLSKENNCPDLAHSTVLEKILSTRDASFEIIVSEREDVSRLVTI